MSSLLTEARIEDKSRAKTYSINWVYVIGIAFYHVVALLALTSIFFSWAGLLFALVNVYLFNTLGINVFYHRFLTHKGLRCRKWAEYSMAVLAVCSFQDTPARWVAIHRRHHEHSDDEFDPHSPIRSFLWAHIGWILVHSPELSRYEIFSRYAKDVLRDPFYRKLEKHRYYLGIVFAHWLLFFVVGAIAGALLYGTLEASMYVGASALIWGVFFRTVLGWHITWAVNSVTHVWGYKNYETDENSRNNVLIGLLSNGEGWHNNHHADPRSARHGHRWWEVDVTYMTIRALAALGIVWDIVEPRERPPQGVVSVASTGNGESSS
ncbi:MAG: fatty acid desaturase [Pseudomonadota bacterium]